MIFLVIIYILGFIATMLGLYCSLEHGEKIAIGDIAFALLISAFSWLAFVLCLFLLFADFVVFTKK